DLGLLWGAVAVLFLIHTAAYAMQSGWVISLTLREMVDRATGPVTYTVGSMVAFAAVIYWRRFFTNPQVGWGLLKLSLFAAGWAFTDPNFRAIVAKEDNVPISMLIYCVAFFTWLALYRAVQNDDRISRGEPVLEKVDDEKVLVWPDLVYTELIAMIL